MTKNRIMKNEIFIGLYDNLGMNILLNKERKGMVMV